jgi:MFS family permease
VIGGVLGVVVGGVLSDRWLQQNRGALYLVSALSMAMSVVCGTFILFAPAPCILSAVAATQFFFFLNTAPMAAAILNSVGRRLRAPALALSMFISHALGDVISPVLIGWIADRSSLRVGMEIALAPLVMGTCALLAGARAMQQQAAHSKAI